MLRTRDPYLNNIPRAHIVLKHNKKLFKYLFFLVNSGWTAKDDRRQ